MSTFDAPIYPKAIMEEISAAFKAAADSYGRHCGTCYWDSDELQPRCHDCDSRTGYYKWEPKRDASEREEGSGHDNG